MSSSRGAEADVKHKYDLVDPATLDCPFCEQPFSPPVFQVIVSMPNFVNAMLFWMTMHEETCKCDCCEHINIF